MIELYFKSQTQLYLFFLLLNYPKGLNRTQICNKMLLPRTTVYDNLSDMKERYIVNSYKLIKFSVGRPIIIWYVSKRIRHSFIQFKLPKIYVNGNLIN